MDYLWDQFPHPTRKDGSEATYQTFGDVFVDFFSRRGNFDYLQTRGILGIPLVYKFHRKYCDGT